MLTFKCTDFSTLQSERIKDIAEKALAEVVSRCAEAQTWTEVGVEPAKRRKVTVTRWPKYGNNRNLIAHVYRAEVVFPKADGKPQRSRLMAKKQVSARAARTVVQSVAG